MDESTARSRHSDSIGQTFLWALLPSLALLLIAPSVGDAQEVVLTNITPSALPACPGPCGLGVTVVTTPLLGTTVTTITGGARPGNGLNLFHSFGEFDVGTGDVANFFNDTGLPTSNILSRVTGGNPSQIYGTIQTTDFSGANLFLINPAGVLFGATAVLDLGAVTGSAVREPGSFYATTADYLNLGDAASTSPFHADPLKSSVLSVAPVAAFGFLALEPGVTRGTISVQGSNLEIPQGQSLSLVGGDITIQAGTLEDGTIQASSLRGPGGQLNLVSVASPGEVLVPSFQTGSFTTMGAVTIKEGVTLDVSGQLDVDGNPIGKGNSGTVFVRGGQLVMDTSTILANTVGAVDGASAAVDIQVSQDVTLTNGAAITTQTSGPGSGGDILITSSAVQLDIGANINSFTFNEFEAGAGGDITLNVDKLTLKDFALIQSLSGTSSPGFGKGGDVTIQGLPGAEFGAATSVALFGGSSLVSTTFGSGDGGEVAITSESLAMDGFLTTINASTFEAGRGGNIVVSVQQASLSGEASITSHTDFAGAGGTVTVQGLQEGIKADSLTLAGHGSGIISEAFGEGRLGDIEVHVKKVSLTDGAVIQAGTQQDRALTAGNVTIDADSVGISGGSRISNRVLFADAGQVTIAANALTLDNGTIETNTSGVGRAGDVVLDVGSVSLSNGATINSSSSGTEAGAGDAGNVTIMSSGAFTSNASTIATSAENARGGDILIDAQSVQLSNGTLISASSNAPLLPDGAGNAGNITITSDSNVVMQNSKVTTEARNASGGDITINAHAAEMVQLVNSRVSTSVGGDAGEPGASDGGNITIDPQFVILQNSQIIAQANAGAGGAINVISGVFLADPNTVVSASSQQGPQGTVNIQSPVQNLGEQLTPLTQQFSSAAALLAQQCAARVADGKFSTFVVAGREGLPAEPGGFLASPSWTAELLGSNLSGLYPHRPIPSVTGSFQEYDARPIQLAKYGDACRQ